MTMTTWRTARAFLALLALLTLIAPVLLLLPAAADAKTYNLDGKLKPYFSDTKGRGSLALKVKLKKNGKPQKIKKAVLNLSKTDCVNLKNATSKNISLKAKRNKKHKITGYTFVYSGRVKTGPGKANGWSVSGTLKRNGKKASGNLGAYYINGSSSGTCPSWDYTVKK